MEIVFRMFDSLERDQSADDIGVHELHPRDYGFFSIGKFRVHPPIGVREDV